MERIQSIDEASAIASAYYNPDNDPSYRVYCDEPEVIEGKSFYPVNWEPPVSMPLDSHSHSIADNGTVIELHITAGATNQVYLEKYSAAGKNESAPNA